MKTEKQIEDIAKQSLEKYFNDYHSQTKEDLKGRDIVLNTKQWEKDMNTRKTKESKRKEGLQVLRKKIMEDAMKSYDKTFHDR